MTTDPLSKEFKVGDIVEIIDGPFRATQSEIIKIDYSRNEVTVKSLHPIMSVPIVLRIESIQIVEN